MAKFRENMPAVVEPKPLATISLSTSEGAALVVADRLSYPVRRGLTGILASFPSQRLEDEAQDVLMELYREAVAGFETAIVIWALKHLSLEGNPRHTATFSTPPVPMDVRQCCKKTQADWRAWVIGTFLHENDEGPLSWLDSSCFMSRKYGPPPGDAACIIPAPMVRSILQEEIARLIQQARRPTVRQPNGEVPFADFSDALFSRIPVDCFPAGEYAQIAQNRAAYRAAKKAREKRQAEAEAVWRTLTPTLRGYYVRAKETHEALRAGGHEDHIDEWTPQQLAAKAQELLDSDAKAFAKSHRAERGFS